MNKFSTFSYSSLTDLNSFKAKEIIVWMRLQSVNKEDLLNLALVKFNIDYDDAVRIYEKAFISSNIIKSAFVKANDMEHFFNKYVQPYFQKYLKDKDDSFAEDLAEVLESSYMYSIKESEYMYELISTFLDQINTEFPEFFSGNIIKSKLYIPQILSKFKQFKQSFISNVTQKFPFNEKLNEDIKNYLSKLKNAKIVISNISKDNTELYSLYSNEDFKDLREDKKDKKDKKERAKEYILKSFPNTSLPDVLKEIKLLEKTIANKNMDTIITLFHDIGPINGNTFPEDFGYLEATIALNQFIEEFNAELNNISESGTGLKERLLKQKAEKNKQKEENNRLKEVEQTKTEEGILPEDINNKYSRYKKLYHLFDNYSSDFKKLKEYTNKIIITDKEFLSNYVTSLVKNTAEKIIFSLIEEGIINFNKFKKLIEDEAYNIREQYISIVLQTKDSAKSSKSYKKYGDLDIDIVLKGIIFYLNVIVVKYLIDKGKGLK